METKQVKQTSLSDLKAVKSEQLDLKQFHNKSVIIEIAEVVQVPSKFTPLVAGSQTEHIPQWVLRVKSGILATIGEGEEAIEFRASEIFNLVQDEKGDLTGYPEHEQSNLAKFMKDINAKKPEEILGKSATVKSYDKNTIVDGKPVTRTYLKFKY